MVRITALVLVFFTLSLTQGTGQDSTLLLGKLKKFGFQNIRIDRFSDNAWRVDLENGRFRFTPYGFRRFLEDWDSGRDTFHFVFRERDIAAAHLVFHENKIGSIDWDDSWLEATVGRSIPGTSNFWQVNIPIGLGLRYIIGIPNNHEAVALDILPGVDITMGRGWSLQGAMAIPVINDYDPKKNVRLSHVSLVRDIRLPDRLFLSLAAGVFQRNRVGVHLKWRKFLNGEQFAVGMDASLTGYTELTGPNYVPRTEERLRALYTLRLDYLWREKNILFELHAGEVFFDELGLVGRVFRQFDETRMGFELRWTDEVKDWGFFVRVPLAPRKYTRPSRVRVTGAPYMDINYSYKRFGHRDQFYQMANTLVDGLCEYWPGTIQGRGQ